MVDDIATLVLTLRQCQINTPLGSELWWQRSGSFYNLAFYSVFKLISDCLCSGCMFVINNLNKSVMCMRFKTHSFRESKVQLATNESIKPQKLQMET